MGYKQKIYVRIPREAPLLKVQTGDGFDGATEVDNSPSMNTYCSFLKLWKGTSRGDELRDGRIYATTEA